MSEHSPEALFVALAISRQPNLLRLARRSPLPSGITLLLEVAAGDSTAIREAQAVTRSSEALLMEAAGFFTEQVLLNRRSDSYRVLGASSNAPSSQLRRHMALILKWLHPDLVPANGDCPHFNKSALATLATGAWETVKTAERRAAYDAMLRTRASQTAEERSLASDCSPERSNGGLALYKLRRDTFWMRVLFRLGRLR